MHLAELYPHEYRRYSLLLMETQQFHKNQTQSCQCFFLLNIFICSIHRNYINKIKSIVVQNKTINLQNECIDKVVFSIKNIQRK